MPVMFWNGQVLFRAAFGGVAMDPACCCGVPCCGCIDLTDYGEAEDIPLDIDITGGITWSGTMQRRSGDCQWEVFTDDTWTETGNCDFSGAIGINISLLCCALEKNRWQDFRLFIESSGTCPNKWPDTACANGYSPSSGTCNIDTNSLDITFNITVNCEGGDCSFTVRIQNSDKVRLADGLGLSDSVDAT